MRRLLDRHDAGADVDANRIWGALLMLELWHREFIDPPAGAGGRRLKARPMAARADVVLRCS